MRLVIAACLLLCTCTRKELGGREGGGDVAPTARERAIGRVDDLPPALRRAFSPDGFVPLGAPAPGDWLAEHPERGQTFDDLVASRPNRPTDARRTIYFVALGDVGARARRLLPTIVDYAGRFFQLPTRELPPLSLDAVGATERNNPYTDQRQLLTGDILAYLRDALPADAFCLVAFTEVDLYPEPSWNFVFGQASLRERVGVYSIARYDPAFYGETLSADDADRVIERRALKVMSHEVGHMFGLSHCVYYACAMNGSNHLEESDRRPFHLCPVDLHKLQWSVGFDPAERYRALEEFYRQQGFSDEAAFAAARRAAIDATR
jgi:archaemetzincin